MQSITILVLACCVAAVFARAHHDSYPAIDSLVPEDASIQESLYETPEHDRSPRTKRGLLLLKKKLLLGALGLKAIKIGALGAGALALKSGSFGGSSGGSYGAHASSSSSYGWSR